MITIPGSLAEQLSSEFAQACAELAQARHRQRLKDTTAHRAAVAEWQTTIDLVVDLFLETAVDRPYWKDCSEVDAEWYRSGSADHGCRRNPRSGGRTAETQMNSGQPTNNPIGKRDDNPSHMRSR
jgi:hypothetical protein